MALRIDQGRHDPPTAGLGAGSLSWTLARYRPFPGAGTGLAVIVVLMLPLASEGFGVVLGTRSAILTAVAAALIAVLGVLIELSPSRRRSDPSTGLPNARALSLAIDCGTPLALAVVRIDRLAEIAAVIGEPQMPLLIHRVCERLRLGTGGAGLYRTDQDAIAWIVPANAIALLDDHFAALAAVLRAPIACAGRSIDIDVSFGVAEGDGGDACALATAALIAAQRARAAGTRWERAGSDDRAAIDWQLTLMGELDRAIDSGALWVAYQPKLEIATGRIVGAEALVRWQHPRRGNIPPDQFIPIVEAHGRAGAMTMYVLDTALGDVASWRRIGRPIGVAVNVSATLLTSDRLLPEIAAALARHLVPAEMLTLEITESAAIVSADAAIDRLKELQALGVRISIDDYGTGQSTMTYLKRFPASELKIDKSFVKGLVEGREDQILVRSTIDLAHALGMTVVAEGVEDAACLDRLRTLGCDVAQGWQIGRPMPAENLSLLQAWSRVA